MAAPGLAPSGASAEDKDILSCRGSADPGFYVDPANCRVFFRPGHPAGFLGIEVRTNFKGSKAIFPDLLGAAGGEITRSKKNGTAWRFGYPIPAGSTDSGSKEIRVEAADGSGAGEAIPIYSDGTAPDVEITSPQPGRVLTMPKLDVTVEGADLADPRMQPSGIQSLELFEIGTQNGQPYQKSIRQVTVASLPYTFVKAKVSPGVAGLMVRATDNVGNSGDSPIVPICVEGSSSCNQPPPSDGFDEWTTAPTVSSLPYTSPDIDTDDLSAGDDDPECYDQDGDLADYESSAWFKVQLAADADVFVTTRGSRYDDGDGETRDVLDTVLMVAVINNGRPSPIMCVDDTADDDAHREAELTFHAHAGMAFYVMAGAFYDPEPVDPNDPDSTDDQVGFIKVEMQRR